MIDKTLQIKYDFTFYSDTIFPILAVLQNKLSLRQYGYIHSLCQLEFPCGH